MSKTITDLEMRVHDLPMNYRARIREALNQKDFKVTLRNCYKIEDHLSLEMSWSRIARSFLPAAMYGEFMVELPYIKSKWRDRKNDETYPLHRQAHELFAGKMGRDLAANAEYDRIKVTQEYKAEEEAAVKARDDCRKEQAKLFCILFNREAP